MRGIFREVLAPIVSQRIGGHAPPIKTRTVRTTGIAESALPERLGDAVKGFRGLSLAYLPGQEGVDLRLTSRTFASAEADVELRRGADVLRERVGSPVYAEGDVDLAEVVLQLLRTKGKRLAVAESCTGGLLGARLTAIPGSSDVFLGGVISYANEVKEGLLGVRRETLTSVGAVSQEVAREMAAGARSQTGAEAGVAITGVAGPGGGTPAKPVGTVCIAVDYEGDVLTLTSRMIGDRAEIRFRATQAALDMVRRRVAGL
jgi:nicotinamide-nucleotide amidase